MVGGRPDPGPRRIDPVLEEARDLLPPGVDVVALPADGGAGAAPSGPAADAMRADAVADLLAAWHLLFPDRSEPADVDVRWTRSTTSRGPTVWVEASTARRVQVTATGLEQLVTALRADGRVVDRRHRGEVLRVLARTATTSLEVQVRPGDGVVAMRARSTVSPADAFDG